MALRSEQSVQKNWPKYWSLERKTISPWAACHGAHGTCGRQSCFGLSSEKSVPSRNTSRSRSHPRMYYEAGPGTCNATRPVSRRINPSCRAAGTCIYPPAPRTHETPAARPSAQAAGELWCEPAKSRCEQFRNRVRTCCVATQYLHEPARLAAHHRKQQQAFSACRHGMLRSHDEAHHAVLTA